MSEIAVSPDKLYELERFLYKEASFLDRPDLDKWMELYTEDGTYWMPAIPDQEDAEMHISLFYDDRVMMEVRRRNFVHPAAASKEYVVRASHIISNIQVTELDERNGDCTVTSNFHCFLYYHDRQTPYAGTYTHQLVRDGDSYKIKSKRVDIINCDTALNTIIIYI
ncbi:MAG: aromatic-ring-hydroxylating dioxygenase subunit beta [Pseudomonadota bacterium]|nr:aromatic-ring-hydroxylating dioxygenase subunit beta [Pseudomonadota bacterium]MEE3237039.1 aromatic-ring-hydroxylating dioxygenase subunit beta [Pseudomonadota bacterium]